jgi:predicted O-methyltransferase YrrM
MEDSVAPVPLETSADSPLQQQQQENEKEKVQGDEKEKENEKKKVEPVQQEGPFEGITYRCADVWFPIVPLDEFRSRPIRYLEIGTLHGANLLSVARTYGAHAGSQLHCIDPWISYGDYHEYEAEQDRNYLTFFQNVARSAHVGKIHIHRGFSHEQVPKLPDDSFDIIYVDGNHHAEYVLEDGVLAFRKLKVGGYLIFDDYDWGGPDMVTAGINGFAGAYKSRVRDLGVHCYQKFFVKLA